MPQEGCVHRSLKTQGLEGLWECMPKVHGNVNTSNKQAGNPSGNMDTRLYYGIAAVSQQMPSLDNNLRKKSPTAKLRIVF